VKKSAALGISRSGGARNPHVFQHTLRFLRSGGTRPPFARDDFFTNSEPIATLRFQFEIGSRSSGAMTLLDRARLAFNYMQNT
jgi:hypothetical protein